MDIDGFVKAVEALDQADLEREIDMLREEQARINAALTMRLDALDVKKRWAAQDAGEPIPAPARMYSPDSASLSTPIKSIPNRSADVNTNGAQGPRGTAAVREVMKDGGTFTLDELFAALLNRGWVSQEAQHPKKATETALHRLFKSGEVDRVARGTYTYHADPATRGQGQSSQVD